jgi:hypothetical protein
MRVSLHSKLRKRQPAFASAPSASAASLAARVARIGSFVPTISRTDRCESDMPATRPYDWKPLPNALDRVDHSCLQRSPELRSAASRDIVPFGAARLAHLLSGRRFYNGCAAAFRSERLVFEGHHPAADAQCRAPSSDCLRGRVCSRNLARPPGRHPKALSVSATALVLAGVAAGLKISGQASPGWFTSVFGIFVILVTQTTGIFAAALVLAGVARGLLQNASTAHRDLIAAVEATP